MGNSIERSDQHGVHHDVEEPATTQHVPNSYADTKMGKGKLNWKIGCGVCLFILLGFIIFIIALAVIIISITSAVATNFYSKDMSGRLVALVILAVTAAITITTTIMGVVGLSKKKKNAMYAAAAVMIVLAIIQAIILGVSVKVSTDDEYQITNSLINTYAYARAKQPKFLDRWSSTEHDLRCCGVNGPEDYRTSQTPYYFPPDISISCCESYKPNLSTYVQEREREICKAKREYYAEGCKGDVIRMFKDSADCILGAVITLIVLEVIYAIAGVLFTKLRKDDEDANSGRRSSVPKEDKKEEKPKNNDKNGDKKDEKKEDKKEPNPPNKK